MIRPYTTATFGLLLSISTFATGADWPQWRGPDFNGSSTDRGLPVSFSRTNLVAWSQPLPGLGASTPVILDARVYVSVADPASRTLQALALDRTSGRILWQKKVADGFQRDDRSTYASPSAVASSDRVFFTFGTGDLTAFNPEGVELWHKNLQTEFGEFAYQWTYSSTPMLYQGRLYVQVLHRNQPVHGKGRVDGESFLAALDPATGKTLWRQVRPSDSAAAESQEAYSTPFPFTHQGRTEILVTGGDCITGHDVADGHELWRWGSWNPTKIGHWRLVPSPVAGAGIALACAPKGSPIYAVKAGANGRVPDSGLAWVSTEQRALSADVPTPAFSDGDFFVLSDVRKSIARIEPATARVKWQIETPGRSKYEASPTVADGRVYLMNFQSEVVVLDASNGTVLSVNPMGDEGEDSSRATVAVARGHLYIRTNHKLWCIGSSSR